MKRLIRNLLQRADYDLARRAYPASASHAEFNAARNIVAGATMLTDARQATLFDQVRYCHAVGVRGAVVECGVWKGGAVGLAALALKGVDAHPTRDLHLFDVFDDICAPDPKVDGERAIREFPQAQSLPAGTRPVPMAGAYDAIGGHGTVEACRDLIERRIGYPSEHVYYHVGWFEETLPRATPSLGPISVLRLDGDWYASTMVCLEHLYHLVEPGGFVIVDDYGAYEGCRRAVDEFLRSRGLTPFLHRVDSVCYYIQK
jgi:O-methyltransferase